MRRPAPSIAKRLARWVLALAVLSVAVPAPSASASRWLDRPVAVAVASPAGEVASARAPARVVPREVRSDVLLPLAVVTAAPALPDALAGRRRLFLLYQRFLC